MKARYRNKLNKIIIELEYEGKWYYVKTLPRPEIQFRQECLKKCLDLDTKKTQNQAINSEELLLININRNPEDEENKTLKTLDAPNSNVGGGDFLPREHPEQSDKSKKGVK